MKDTSPKLVTSKELLELGFHPSGDIYWLFELDEKVNDNFVDKVLNLVLANGVMKVQPYIVELDIK